MFVSNKVLSICSHGYEGFRYLYVFWYFIEAQSYPYGIA